MHQEIVYTHTPERWYKLMIFFLALHHHVRFSPAGVSLRVYKFRVWRCQGKFRLCVYGRTLFYGAAERKLFLFFFLLRNNFVVSHRACRHYVENKK